jgi:hypothetical protein
MTSDRKPRVDLDPLTNRLLIAEATKRGMRPKALLTKLIEEAASPEAKALVGIVEVAQARVQVPPG